MDISGNLLIRSGSHTPGVPAMGTFKVDIMADLELHIRTDFEPNVLLDYLKLNIDFSKKITASDGSGVLAISGSARVLYPCETCMSFSASAVFENYFGFNGAFAAQVRHKLVGLGLGGLHGHQSASTAAGLVVFGLVMNHNVVSYHRHI